MRIAILGYGKEGRSALQFLKKHPKYKNAGFRILDEKHDKNYLKHLTEFDLVVRSPGIPFLKPEIQEAIKKGVKFSSVTKLFFDECKGIIIGVTGSKGKGTTASLIQKGLQACNEDVHLAGNIGKSPLDLVPKLKKTSVAVLELSSFQLQDLHKSPQIAVVLDVFPEHLDYHKSMKEYIEAKKSICSHQKKRGMVFYFRDDELSKKIARFGKGKKISIPGKDLGLKKNAAMAAAVASCLGCDPEKVLEAIKKFKGLPHRMERVRTIQLPSKKHSNILQNVRVSFYDDSFATNPHSTAMAIFTLSQNPGDIILIAGGRSKVPSFAPLRKALRESKKVKLVVLMGENKGKIKKAIQGTAPIKYVKNLREAVQVSHQKAKSLAASGHDPVSVVMSSGAASFDMFKSYKDRGDKFKALVKKLK